MKCYELIAFVHRYLDGELSTSESSVFDQHLTVCPDCRAFLDSYQTTVQLETLAFAEPDAPVPEEVPETLVTAVLAATRGPARGPVGD